MPVEPYEEVLRSLDTSSASSWSRAARTCSEASSWRVTRTWKRNSLPAPASSSRGTRSASSWKVRVEGKALAVTLFRGRSLLGEWLHKQPRRSPHNPWRQNRKWANDCLDIDVLKIEGITNSYNKSPKPPTKSATLLIKVLAGFDGPSRLAREIDVFFDVSVPPLLRIVPRWVTHDIRFIDRQQDWRRSGRRLAEATLDLASPRRSFRSRTRPPFRRPLRPHGVHVLLLCAALHQRS